MRPHRSGLVFSIAFLLLTVLVACGGGGGGGGGADGGGTAPVAPSGLIVTVLSSSSIQLDWVDNSDNEDAFKVWMGAGLYVTSAVQTLPQDQTTCIVDGLLPDTLYTFQVMAYNKDGDASSPAESATTDPPPVNAPTDLVVLPWSSSEARLSWTDNAADEDGFAVYRGTSASTVDLLVGSTAADEITFTDTGLSTGVTYYYEVRAAKGTGESYPTDTGSIQLYDPEGSYSYNATAIATAGLCTPSSVIVSGTGTATITETDVRQIRIDLESGSLSGAYFMAAPDLYQAVVSGTFHGAVVQSLILRFTANWLNGYSVGAGTVNTGPCQGYFINFVMGRQSTAPTGLGATALSSTSISLSWTDASDDEDGFRIYRGTSPGDISAVAGTVGAGITTFTDNGLTPSTTYYYEVVSYNGAAESGRSNTASAMTAAPPATVPNAPSLLTATPVNGTRIDLSWWDNSGNETLFYIYRGPSAASLSMLTTVSANTTSYSDNSLTPGSTYYYQVKAYNTAGLSGASNTVSATTPAVPAAPSNLAASPVSGNEIYLSWTDNSNNETAFKIYQAVGSCSNTFNYLGAVDSPATGVSIIQLSPDTTYCYKVKATNAEGDSGFSNTASATTLTQTATLRIINNLINTGGMDQYNSIIRVRIGNYVPVLGAECNSITDPSTERLNLWSSLPADQIGEGKLIQAGYTNPTSIHQEDFDVSGFTSGNYCVWIQAGWWDYYIPGFGDPYWTIHPTVAYACDGVTQVNKEATFYVTGQSPGELFTTYVSEWLPHYSWPQTGVPCP